ncbi:MAG TPA: hypothetical protein VIG33_00725 [Pseudobdellovibrionaceae bacterium]|jgi:hypothetical protein
MAGFSRLFRIFALSFVLLINFSRASFAEGGEHFFRSKPPRVEPFFFLDFDWGTWTVNLTPYNPKPSSLSESESLSKFRRDRMIMDDYRDGLQKLTHGTLSLGLGAKVAFWYRSFSDLLTRWWSYVGIMPIVGVNVESVRYFKTVAEARHGKGYLKVPGHASDLISWSQGDSITYICRGGLLFGATIGYSLVDAGAALVAQGTWETYIEKIEENKIYLKITKGKMATLSAFTAATIVELSVAGFKSRDDGFSFLYNLNTEVGRKAYEDAIRGNIIASEKIAEAVPTNYVEAAPVLKVSTFKNLSTGRLISAELGLPLIWNKTYSRGKVLSYSATDFHVKNKVAKVNYGIYSEKSNYRFFNRQRETDVRFYGSHYTIEEQGKTDVGMFGRYGYAYMNDHSSGEKLNGAVRKLINLTAMDELQVDIPQENLAYAAIDFNTTLSKEHTLHLMDLAQREGKRAIYKVADRYLQSYSLSKDVYGYCKGIHPQCWLDLRDDSYNAIEKMYRALLEMYTEKNRDAKAFARAYGEFGEAMAKNFITFRTVLELAGPGVEINYLIEGARMSMYYKSWTTTEVPNQWSVANNPNDRGKSSDKNSELPFEPRLHRSKTRGIIVNPNHGGLVFLQAPVKFGIAGLPLTLDTSLNEVLNANYNLN